LNFKLSRAPLVGQNHSLKLKNEGHPTRPGSRHSLLVTSSLRTSRVERAQTMLPPSLVQEIMPDHNTQHPASRTHQTSPNIPHPTSIIHHPAPIIPHLSNLTQHPSSSTPHPTSSIQHPASRTQHPSFPQLPTPNFLPN
jgi:hypothetical protein